VINIEVVAKVADETGNALRAEIDHLRGLARLVTDERVLAEIEKMIQELEQRLRERD
jgi:hypothetical protein